MRCEELLSHQQAVSEEQANLRRVEATRPPTRRTSSRFEDDMERARSGVNWATGHMHDHIKKCKICQKNGQTEPTYIWTGR